MLSFELSIIDIVLAIGIIILLLLYITRTPTKYAAEPETSRARTRERRRPVEELKKNIVMQKVSKKKESSHTRSQEGPLECPHHFGYLKTLSKRSSIPEECYSCSRMMQCVFSSE